MPHPKVKTLAQLAAGWLSNLMLLKAGGYDKAVARFIDIIEREPDLINAKTLVLYAITQYREKGRITPEDAHALRTTVLEAKGAPCWKCGGDGKYWMQREVQDKPELFAEICYPCAGKGWMSEEDAVRTDVYYAKYYRVPTN